MKLQDIFSQLSTGEFSQLAIGGQDSGVVNDKNYKQIINHINLGLATLYRRFHLKENRLTLQLQPNQTVYQLQSKFAVNNRRSRETVRTIIDTAAEPFNDDIIKIKKVLTDAGEEVVLNDQENHYSFMTPSMNILSVPKGVTGTDPDLPDWLKTNTLTVVYQANHPLVTIPLGLFDPNRTEMELPYSHLDALLYFIASRVHNPVGMTNEFHAGNNYNAKFEAACAELEMMNLRVDQGSQVNRMRRGGWA